MPLEPGNQRPSSTLGPLNLRLTLVLLPPGQGFVDVRRVVVCAAGAVKGESTPADGEARLNPMPGGCEYRPGNGRLADRRPRTEGKVHHTAS